MQFYQAGLDRINDQWSGKGTSGARFDVPHHIYADDLDLFGTDSLFELLCAARTQMGENTLAQWLLAPAELETIRARHAAIADLRERFAFRESMATDGESLRITLHPETLDAWARAPNRLDRAWMRWTAPLSAGLAVGAIVIWAVWGFLFPLLAVILLEAALSYVLRKPIHAAITTVESAYEDLKGLAVLLNRIEAERFEAAPLRELQSKLSSHNLGASAAISKLATIVSFVEARRNPILAPLLLLFMYPLQTALAAERWRSAHGAVIDSWLKTLGEFEALLSLAQYAFEQSGDTFPEFLDGRAQVQGNGPGPSFDPRRGARLQRRGHFGADARVAGQRLEHVGQEHAVAHRRHQHRACHGRRAGAREIAAADSPADRREYSHQRFAARRQLALLRGDHAPAPLVRAARAAAAVLVGRTAAGHEFGGPARRRAGTHPRIDTAEARSA